MGGVLSQLVQGAYPHMVPAVEDLQQTYMRRQGQWHCDPSQPALLTQHPRELTPQRDQGSRVELHGLGVECIEESDQHALKVVGLDEVGVLADGGRGGRGGVDHGGSDPVYPALLATLPVNKQVPLHTAIIIGVVRDASIDIYMRHPITPCTRSLPQPYSQQQ